MATKQILSPTSLEVGTALGSMERPIVKQSSIGLRTIRVLHQNESFLSSILVSGVFRSGWHWCLEILKQKIWAYINKLTNVQESLEVFGIRHYPKITRLLEHPLLPAPSQSLVITCFLGLLKKNGTQTPIYLAPRKDGPRFSRLLCLDTTFCKAKVTASVLFKTNRTFQTGADWRCICELCTTNLPQIYANWAFFFWISEMKIFTNV